MGRTHLPGRFQTIIVASFGVFSAMKQLLLTKFYVPSPQAGLLLRPRLLQKLDEGCNRPVTLISASAGFGKSTLLSQWVAAASYPVTWLSLDENDNAPIRFTTYLIAALQKIDSAVGHEALDILHSSPSPPFELILTQVVNETARIPHHFILVLDDFHFIEDEQVNQIIAFLFANMPPQMHLFISTRLDPPLPLARMRAGRELVEVRSNDLRLTLDETEALMKEVLGFRLSREDIRLLDEYVEGWAAGLQLVVLSMQGRENLSGFLEDLRGQNRFILEYLMEEVLGRQTSDTRNFLLTTSILERLNASLCNTLLEREDSQEMLIRLQQSNTFLMPLDHERTWYRYHHLFADLLQNQLRLLAPEQVANLHARASGWYDREGWFTEAISHALNGKDLDRAAGLYEKYGLKVMSSSREENLAGWLDLLPLEMIHHRPWLCILKAWLHYSVGTRAKAEEFLKIAEQWTGSNSRESELPPDPISLPAEECQRLKVAIASIRAHILIVERDFQSVLDQVDLAFDILSAEDPRRSTAMVALGLAYWALGDREKSEQTFAKAAEIFRMHGDLDGLVSSLCYRGVMQVKQGQLRPALPVFREALVAATRQDGTKILFASIPYLRIGDLMREWNDLAGAQEHIDLGLVTAKKLNHPDVLIEAYICRARLALAGKNPQDAHAALHQADMVMAANQVDPWYIGWLDECWLRYWLSEGDLAQAIALVERRGLTPDGTLEYHHDLHHLNLARVLIARGVQDPSGQDLKQARQLLNRLQEAAEKADWIHETIKIMVLKSLVRRASGEKERALDTLSQALRAAYPGGYVRLFIDEGAPMAAMLDDLLAQRPGASPLDGHLRAYAGRLLEALHAESAGTFAGSQSIYTTLVEPLSERELEVLRYLKSHLTNSEIAFELGISANTVRFHIKNIYSKLNVHRRGDAVHQGKKFGIL